MARIKPQALLVQSKRKKGPSSVSISTIIVYGLILGLLALSLFATYRHWSQRPVEVEQTDSEFSTIKETRSAVDDFKMEDLPGYAVLETSKGSITVELLKDNAPEIVDQFIGFCQKGHFKGMPFQYVIKNYVIQGGDSEVLQAADWTSKEKLRGQLLTSPKHEAFMVGTSKKKQDEKKFELFITTAPIPNLNNKLAVFGRVVKGEDVVQEIEEVDTDAHYRPKSHVEIVDVSLKREI